MMPLRLQTLSSIFIMDIPETNLESIVELVKDQKAEAALPCNLSTELLRQIGRDSMLVHLAEENDDDEADYPFEGATYLVFHLMAMRAEKLYGVPGCNLSLERLDHWVKRYFHYAERELRCRSTNNPQPDDSRALFSEIDSELLALHGQPTIFST